MGKKLYIYIDYVYVCDKEPLCFIINNKVHYIQLQNNVFHFQVPPLTIYLSWIAHGRVENPLIACFLKKIFRLVKVVPNNTNINILSFLKWKWVQSDKDAIKKRAWIDFLSTVYQSLSRRIICLHPLYDQVLPFTCLARPSSS